MNKLRIDKAIEILNKYQLMFDKGTEYCSLLDALERLKAYEDTGLEPEEIQDLKDCIENEEGAEGTVDDLFELMRYRKLEAEGLLIKLPCKLGTKIFYTKLTKTYVGTVGKRESYSVEEMFLNEDNLLAVINAWNETVFLTQEEAEKALKGDTSHE